MPDAPAYYFNAQLLTAGIGIFTFIQFLSVALLHRTERMYGYFALTCLAMGLSSVFTALSAHANTSESVFAMLHWRGTFISLVPPLLVRVVAAYSGKPAPRLILGITDITALILEIFNFLIPESICNCDETRFKTFIMPWGEVLSLAIIKAGPLLQLGWFAAIVALLWGCRRAIYLFKSGSRWLGLLLGLGIVLTLMTLSARLLIYSFTGSLVPSFTELGFCALIIPMSVALGVQLQKQALNLAKTITILHEEIAHREETKKQFWQLAYIDSLTGLPNRHHFISQLQKSLAFKLESPVFAAVLLVDLDRFTIINDTLGHDVGDHVLKETANRLKAALIKENVFISRMVGDEFAVLLTPRAKEIADVAQRSMELADAILRGLKTPMACGGHRLFIEAAIGIATLSNADGDWSNVIRKADMALHEAKSRGNRIQCFEPSMQARMDASQTIGNSLRQAIGNNELLLHFQPQLALDGLCVGAEVLLRWRHPEQGMIPPSTFIPIAEENGLINDIGDWVMKTACTRLMAWKADNREFAGHISINVSSWQFDRPDYVEHLHAMVSAIGVSPEKIVIEITESALLGDLAIAKNNLIRLKNHGFGISLDDFGTGFSSLSYLRNLPFDELKIDKSFVSELRPNTADPLVESIIHIGKRLDMRLVAEGVENENQRQALLKMGFEGILQGYLLSRPLTEEDFLDWLERETPCSGNTGPILS